MLLRLVWVLAGQISVGGETFSYEYESAPLAPFAAEVEITEPLSNATVFLYSDQSLQRVRISVAVSAAKNTSTTLFQFQTVPLTLWDSEVSVRVDSELGGLGLFGIFASEAALTVADSTITYQIWGDVTSLSGMGEAVPKLAVKNSKVAVLAGIGVHVSAVAGLAVRSGELQLENTSVLFQVEDWVDEFVGLVGQQQGEVTVANMTLSGEISARTSALGLFRETEEVVRLQDSALSLALTVPEDGTVAPLAGVVKTTFSIVNCTLNTTAQRGLSTIQQDQSALVISGQEYLDISDSGEKIVDPWSDSCDSQEVAGPSVTLDLDTAELLWDTREHVFFFPGSINYNNTEIKIIGARTVSAGTGQTVFSLFEDRPLYYNVSVYATY